MPQESSNISRQALLLFIQEFRKERKQFGFGNQMDRSVHLALQHRTYDLLQQFTQTDIIIVHNGNVPSFAAARYLPERGDDFNARFINALQDTFDLGYERVVAVGGDIPTLHDTDIEKALNHDAPVLGPTHDGGFYLAALSRDDVPLFNQLPWRQPILFERLRKRLQTGNRSYLLLPRRRDIDHAADARSNASLLMRLVKRWLGQPHPRLIPTDIRFNFTDRIPEPRYSSLPPPQFLI